MLQEYATAAPPRRSPPCTTPTAKGPPQNHPFLAEILLLIAGLSADRPVAAAPAAAGQVRAPRVQFGANFALRPDAKASAVHRACPIRLRMTRQRAVVRGLWHSEETLLSRVLGF